mgnify:CR=1 FL=1
MLRYTRIFLATVSLLAVALLFIDVTGFAAVHWAWMAKWQLVPALLSLNIVIILILVALTLTLGRVYCSVICPLGVMQDGISSVAMSLKVKKASSSGAWLIPLFCGILVIIGGIYGFFHLIFAAQTIGFMIGVLLSIYGVKLILSAFEKPSV